MAAAKGTKRFCLVTVGATVGFRKLTAAVLEPDFWRHMAAHGFTDLRVQCGPDEPWAAARVESQKEDIPTSFSIKVFASRDNLMMEEMTLCKASGNDRSKGLIIGHAGEHQPTSDILLQKANGRFLRHGHNFGRMEAGRPNDCRSQHGSVE